MPKVAPIYYNFNGGEISPLLASRPDLDKYKTGLDTCENFIPIVQGPAIRRSGTVFVSEAKDSGAQIRLLPFVFSRDQAYVLEFGDGYIRFYTEHGRVVFGPFSEDFSDDFAKGSTYEISSPYATADLRDLHFAQSADILYLTHPDYPQYELRRYGNTDWRLVLSVFYDGPYEATNTTDTTMKLTGAGSTRRITASDVVGVNGGEGFTDSDIGRMIRINLPTPDPYTGEDENIGWQWVTIETILSTTSVNCFIDNDDAEVVTDATTEWRMGLWCERNGYPRAVTFSGDRLFYGGVRSFPQRFDGSRSGDYYNYAPTDPDGTVVADHALGITLNANEVNDIYWMADDEKGLVIGTEGGEWVVRPNESGGVLTPDNIDAKRVTTHGSDNVQAVRAGKAIMYVTPSGRKIREMTYVFEDDGFRSPDATLIAEHVTGSGVTELAYQREPQPILWAVRSDGQLAGMTYERDNQVIGWHRHVLGGDDAKVESIAVIPSPDEDGEELWMCVSRTIDGSTVRYVEYMKKLILNDLDAADCYFVDGGLTYSGASTVSLTGLDHLEGQTVSILANGAVHPDVVVESGGITLDYAVTEVAVGLKYKSKLKTLRPDDGSANGTAQGKIKRINKLIIRLWNTVGGSIGPREGKTDDIIIRNAGDLLDTAIPLYTGDYDVEWDSQYDTNAQIYVEQEQPLPFALLGMYPRMVTQDG